MFYINDKQNRYFLSDPLFFIFHIADIYIFMKLDKYPVLNHINRVLNTEVERVESECVVCQTKAHHIVVPFVMASRLFSNNDLPRLTLYRVSWVNFRRGS